MERSLPSLTFKGSISEAIVEAKRQRKLFVVYISGEDAESIRLENSTWADLNVAEKLSKYCILLHILEGSTEASHFSAIYPQKPAPCITVIGYNGVQLWQNEGFVAAEILASNLEKTWLSLHIQETTATVLTAALALKKSDPLASGAPNIASLQPGSSSSMDVPSSSINKDVESSEARPLVASEIIEENKSCEHPVKENIEVGDATSSKVLHANELDSGENEQPTSSNATAKELLPITADLNNSEGCPISPTVKDGCPAPEENSNFTNPHLEVSEGSSQSIPTEVNQAVVDTKTENVEDPKAGTLDISTNKSTDVHLNIRLPNGNSLQEKFPVTSTLSMVKDFVDQNQASCIGSYDLAVPYPRKVFKGQDLSKSLSDLGLLNRQALMVVPHQRAVAHHRGVSSSRDLTNSTNDSGSANDSNGGYFALLRSFLSYLNPLSYLGSTANSSNSEQESQNGMWEYRPNPALQNNLRARGTERPFTRPSPDQSGSTTSRSDERSKQPTASRYGSNIHTLKHDEDDDRFSDRNAFWNGNSTQYGGNNDGN